MQAATGEESDGPLPRQAQDAHQDVDNLEGGHGLDGAVEVLGQEVPEDLGPEEGFDGGAYLVWWRVSRRLWV